MAKSFENILDLILDSAFIDVDGRLQKVIDAVKEICKENESLKAQIELIKQYEREKFEGVRKALGVESPLLKKLGSIDG